MTVLSDTEIKDAIHAHTLNIDPFNKKNLTPNGYDLTIDEVYIQSTDKHINKGTVTIPPQTWFAISTTEFITMGSTIASQLWIRSSYARKGVMASFGKVDAGFHGTLTISCYNASHKPIQLPIGDRFCQIVFETLTSIPEALYHQRSGTYQNQRGITLKR